MEIVIFVKTIKPKIKSHILCDKKMIWISYAIIEVAPSEVSKIYLTLCLKMHFYKESLKYFFL